MSSYKEKDSKKIKEKMKNGYSHHFLSEEPKITGRLPEYFWSTASEDKTMHRQIYVSHSCLQTSPPGNYFGYQNIAMW